MGRLLFTAVCVGILVGCYCHQREARTQQLLPARDREIRQASRTIEIIEDDFVVSGKRLHIVSGSLHYFRTPAVYWSDRLRKFKAAGLNTISTYVEWSFHEPEERQYDFSGDRDVAQFVRLAAAEGLHVLLRPGPYICAERDLGGLPYWLLGKYPQIALRTQNKDFMAESKIWLDKLFEQVQPLLYGNGGPIILVQVENEYGSYGSDKVYMTQLLDLIKQHVGQSALLYTTDGYSRAMFTAGSVPGALTTIDFGADPNYNMSKLFAPLRAFMPKGPLMNSEFYPGWLTHWGEDFNGAATQNVVTTLRNMLDYKINVNFYMFYGGTNFEFTAGANWGGTYQPDITSYDYDAPLNEAGDPTPKYYAIRKVLEQYFPEVVDIPLPIVSRKGAYGNVTVNPSVPLLSSEGRLLLGKRYEDTTSPSLPTFEKLRQRSGLVLYETVLNAEDFRSVQGTNTVQLRIAKPRDRIYVFLDGEYVGVLSRMHKLYDLLMNISNRNVTLSLLVENQGRINFGPELHDFKGILDNVVLNHKILKGEWIITGFPLEKVENLSIAHATNERMPMLYEGEFVLPQGTPLDTYLNTDGWGKGLVWVNGHNLGRYWPGLGPQRTLYVPGCWLLAPPLVNRLQVLELEAAPSDHQLTFLDQPLLHKK
nr:beta galactosidase-like protein [Yponomeuta evonymella]